MLSRRSPGWAGGAQVGRPRPRGATYCISQALGIVPPRGWEGRTDRLGLNPNAGCHFQVLRSRLASVSLVRGWGLMLSELPWGWPCWPSDACTHGVPRGPRCGREAGEGGGGGTAEVRALGPRTPAPLPGAAARRSPLRPLAVRRGRCRLPRGPGPGSCLPFLPWGCGSGRAARRVISAATAFGSHSSSVKNKIK